MTVVKKILLMISLAFSALTYSGVVTAESVEIAQDVSTAEIITFNINAADAETIADLMKGVGPKKAQAIVEYRTANGEFDSLESLLAVKGIGNATISKNKEIVVFN